MMIVMFAYFGGVHGIKVLDHDVAREVYARGYEALKTRTTVEIAVPHGKITVDGEKLVLVQMIDNDAEKADTLRMRSWEREWAAEIEAAEKKSVGFNG